MTRIVYACDIGSTLNGRFGWARVPLSGAATPAGSHNIDLLLQGLIADFQSGESVALGFEAPLFMPVPDYSINLSKGRDNEGNRSMFAPAGAYVTALACHQAAFLLRYLSSFASSVKLTFDSQVWLNSPASMLLLWEAFVSGPAHAENNDHIRDAATAAVYFREHHQNLIEKSAVGCEAPLSLIGAAALWAGWVEDVTWLRKLCLVLRPEQSYGGEIRSGIFEPSASVR